MDSLSSHFFPEILPESDLQFPENVSVLPELAFPIVQEARKGMEETGIFDRVVNTKVREEIEKLKQIIARSIPSHLRQYWAEIEKKIFVGTGLFLLPEIAEGNWGSEYGKQNGTIVGENSFQAGYDMTMNFIAHELVSIPFLLGLAGYIKGKNDGGRISLDNVVWFIGAGEFSRVLLSQVPYLESHTVNGYVSVAIFMAIALHTWMKNL